MANNFLSLLLALVLSFSAVDVYEKYGFISAEAIRVDSHLYDDNKGKCRAEGEFCNSDEDCCPPATCQEFKRFEFCQKSRLPCLEYVV